MDSGGDDEDVIETYRVHVSKSSADYSQKSHAESLPTGGILKISGAHPAETAIDSITSRDPATQRKGMGAWRPEE